MAKKNKYEPKLLVLRIKLEYIRPFIVRKVIVRNTISFELLHDIIQISMGWQNEHLYSFSKGDIHIDDEGVVESEAVDDIRDLFTDVFSNRRNKHLSSAETPIARFLNEAKDKFMYEYDFGDSWLHQISVSKVMEDDPSIKHPVCKTAKRACPPEDCGGVYGYSLIMKAFGAEEKDEEDEEYIDWVDEDFDPEFANTRIINCMLEKIEM